MGTASINVDGKLQAGAVQQAVGTGPLAFLSSGGFCGLSGGVDDNEAGDSDTIVTSAVVGSGSTVTVDNVGWTQSVASLIVFEGDTSNGVVAGVVSALPNPTAGSCTNGTAVSFVVVGAGVATF